MRFADPTWHTLCYPGNGRAMPSVSLQPAPLRGATLLGRYRLEDIVGEGSMAVVYRATDAILSRPVAVKVLRPELCREPEFVEPFLEMERRIARLHHPHVVTLLDADQGEHGCFVVMEYLPGGSLRDLLAQRGRLPVHEAARLAAEVAEGLQALHRENIIHGDIKPDNVLLDERGAPQLVDFGIARIATTTGLVDPRHVAGTTPYLAPEQLREGRADARSDVYSLGLVTYELLAGRRAFDGDHWVAVAAQRLERDPAPLADVRGDVPLGLQEALARATARDPDQRFASAAAFAAALAPYTRPAPPPSGRRVLQVVSRPIRPSQPASAAAPAAPRARRTALRPSTAAGLAAVALGLILLAVGGWQATAPSAPSVVGRNVEQARADLAVAGWSVGQVDERTSSRQPWGVVVEQASAGPRAVRLVVSTPPRSDVPSLVDRPIGDAEADLQARGLRLGTVRTEAVEGRRAGTVIAQQPPPGTRVTQGEAVAVTIAVPPPPTPAPAGRP